MRITKKYTGAACLGKRVYHAYRQNGKSDEMERNSIELQILEHEFRAKLAQMSRRRPPDSYNNSTSLVTTPGIDALFKNNPPPQGWAGSMGPGPGGYYPNGVSPGGNFVMQYPPVAQDPGNGGVNSVPPPGAAGIVPYSATPSVRDERSLPNDCVLPVGMPMPQDPNRYAFYSPPNNHAGPVVAPPAHVPHEGMNGSVAYNTATGGGDGGHTAEVPVESMA